ncbi:hypothetical protein HU200_002810 [Digitaria exilis]|uniref:Uncharacterized protein n=1 Tax=Digitaria exilis TaxID=1010633 RepID=A0A835FUP7_9POAL|nr:hypothetical protein HU200_002810 [Digitaria exilis]
MPPFGVISTGAMAPSLAAGLRHLLPAGACAVEDLEHWLEEVRRTLSRLDSKRATLEGQIAAAAAQAVPPFPPAANVDNHDGASSCYTRKGAAGTVRRRLRAAAAGVKKEREKLEAQLGDLEEAVVDARERLTLQPAMN